MVRTLLLYVVICAIPVAAFWLAGRLLGLSRPFSGPTGRAWLDAEDAFDQARRKHQRHRVAACMVEGVLGVQPGTASWAAERFAQAK